ncbi:threonine synthase [Halobacteriales archaeon SW_5_70_135]|nr:MAG: threonine synthase [Halobacteriales archaeon SW_5_70_135]
MVATTAAFDGLACVDCDERFSVAEATGRCPACGGILDPQYDLSAVGLTREELAGRPFDTMWRYEELLPFPRERAVTLDEGATPLVECPELAEAWGLGRVLIKDEGRNPTGSFKDRGATAAVTAAREVGASDVVLASAGNAGQAAAAYAARADLDCHVFLPSRADFVNKAMVNVHGADLTVVGGRIGDAGAAMEDALDEHEHEDWHPVQTFVTPYRHDGKKTMLYETVEAMEFEVPDAVVYPTGGGVGLVGMHKGATELRELGLIDELPSMVVAQSEDCAPIVSAYEAGRDRHEPWATPDTVCGGIEIPDPGASPLVLDAVRESGGTAVATGDDAILDAGVEVARATGAEMGATCAAAASGARRLAAEDELGEDDTVVLLNTAAGSKSADLLRSHLMGQGT